jgi:predicted PurR-regulated permease PerM
MPRRRSLIFLAVALAGLLPFLLQVAWPFITSFILASILAIVMSPAKEWLSRRTHRPALATFLTTFATVLVVGVAVAFAGYTIYMELASAYESLGRRSLEEGGWPALVTHTADRVVDALATRIPVDKEAIRTELIDRMKSAGGFLLNNVTAAIGGATNFVITCIMVAVFLFYLLRYGRAWIDQLALLTPLDPHTTAGILRTAHDSVVANVNGVIAAAVGQGVFLGLGFLFVGVRAPALWGAVGGLASIVPVIGAPLVWVPVVAAFLLMGSYWKALLLLLWCALVVGSIDNVLRPLVVGARAEQQHPVLIALAAIGGAYAFGPMGLLLGPLVIALSAALLKEIRKLIPSIAAEVDSAGEGATRRTAGP